MTSYKLNIVKLEEKSAEFIEKERDSILNNRSYHDRNDPYVNPFRETSALEVTLTEKQWEAVQKTVLSTFK
jgi:hypothetical protein